MKTMRFQSAKKFGWIIAAPGRVFSCNGDFNGSLPENGGVIAARASAPESLADADIRTGKIKTFQDADSLIASLKKPW